VTGGKAKDKAKAKPLIDDKPYVVYCGGVSKRYADERVAVHQAHLIVLEWLEVGIRRSARVSYRDGSLLMTVHSDGTEVRP
jgi:hypothetical protein